MRSTRITSQVWNAAGLVICALMEKGDIKALVICLLCYVIAAFYMIIKD